MFHLRKTVLVLGTIGLFVGSAPAQVRFVNLSRQELHVATSVENQASKATKVKEGWSYSGWTVIPAGAAKEMPAGLYFLKTPLMPLQFNLPSTNGLVNPKGDFKYTLSKANFMQDLQAALFNGYAQVPYYKFDKGTFSHGADFRAESQMFTFGFASVKKVPHKQTFSVGGRVLYYDVNLKEDKGAAFTWTEGKSQLVLAGTTEAKPIVNGKKELQGKYVGTVTVHFIR